VSHAFGFSSLEHPLSHGQAGLWYLERLAPGNGAYHISVPVRVRAEMDVATLKGAIGAIVSRHAALRTVFGIGEDGQPVQRVLPEMAAEISEEDASGWSEEQLRERITEEAGRPFDLARGPLLRIAMLRTGEAESVLLLTIHHLVADFWSISILIRELGALYRGEALPPLARSYADHVERERGILESKGEKLWEYWRERLAGAPPALGLPVDRPRPALQTFRGASALTVVEREIEETVIALGRRRGATPFVTILAAFDTLLSRLSGQDDLVVGSPSAGRRRADLAGVMGYFVNVLPLRADLAGDPSFAELLGRTAATVSGALAHRAYPFPLLAERLQPDRDPGRSPVFQAMLVLQAAHRNEERVWAPFALGEAGAQADLAGLPIESMALPERRVPFDLTVMAAQGENGLALSFQYNADLFEATTAARWASHFRTLLTGIAADPEARLSDLPLFTDAERQQLLEWNAAPSIPGEDVLLHELFHAQAERTPEAVALIDGNLQVTYAELRDRASALARHLRSLGVGPEDRVGICSPRNAGLIAGMIGILEAGAAYVPLDPSYPQARLQQILEDSQPVAVLVGETDALPVTAIPLIPLDVPSAKVVGAQFIAPPLALDNLAYLIYTSGSTGTPKGVAIRHSSAVALVRWAETVFSNEEVSRVLFATSISFDLSVFELFVPLSRGGAVVIAENALALPGLPAAAEVTLVNTVPSAMAELVRTGGVPASVRTVNLAGEPLPRELAEAIYRETGVKRLWDLYGPSEDTTYSTASLVQPGEAPMIGRPIAGTRAYVVDRALQPSPLGVPGELLLGGDGLARGYLGRPGLTAEKWIPDPFSETPGERLYRTGDLARLRPDGELDFLGRIDHQVKVRGFRIELGEIGAVLETHPDVREAVAVVREDRPGDRRIVAYTLGEADPAALRAWVGERLPGYMVPSAFVSLPAFPRTATGKLDRKALPAPAGTRTRSFVAPRTRVEELIAGIWAAVLETERVGIEDDFFSLGGHSLLAIRVLARVQGVFGVELSLRALLARPTVAGLAAEVEAALAAVPAETAVLRRRTEGEEAPLSFGQERLWFLDRLHPGIAAYNVPVSFRLTGSLDRDALAAALSEVVRRHEVLRTVFPSDPATGQPRRQVLPPAPVDLPWIDPSMLEEEARHPFDLGSGPLFRAALARIAPEEHRLLVVQHHTVTDGRSLDLLRRELAALYAGEALPEPPVQEADVALWQRASLRGLALVDPLARERERLAGAPGLLPLPTDRPRPAVPSFHGVTRKAALPDDLAVRLRDLAREEGATSFALFLAAFQALLFRTTGRRDLLVGSPVAVRGREELEGLLGLFVNTVVLRGKPRGDLSFRALLAETRKDALAAIAGADLPLEKWGAGWAPARRPGANPLFQVLFSLEPAGSAGIPAGPLTWSAPEGVDRGAAQLDLSLALSEAGGGLVATIEAAADLFDAATVERLLSSLETLLAAVAANPDIQLADLPVTPELAREEILSVETPAPDVPLLRRAFVAPQTSVEELLAGIWEAELGVERVGSEDDFFSLGGHSLLATRVLARVQGAFGVELPLRVFFARPTVAGLAAEIEAALSGAPVETAVLRRRAEGEEAPLSFGQERLWFIDRLHPAIAAYNVPAAFRITGPLDRDALAAALSEVVRRHEVLRTVFPADPATGWPRRRVLPSAPVDLPWIDPSALEEEARRPFDLGRGPLVRAALARLAPEEHRLLVVQHHAVTDGRSLDLLRRELAALYAGETLPEPSLQEADVALWQRAALRGPALVERLARERERLAGAPALLPLPTDRPRPAIPSFRGVTRRAALPDDLAARLRGLAREEGATSFALFLAAFQALLFRITGRRDLLVGSPVATREREELHGLLGLFVNTVVLRGKPRGGLPFRELLAETRKDALAAIAGADLPLEKVVEGLAPERSPGANPLFQVLFSLEADLGPGIEAGGLTWSAPEGVDRGAAQLDLSLTVSEAGGGLAVAVEAAADLFDAVTVERLLASLMELLAAVAADPDVRLGSLPVLPELVREAVLAPEVPAVSAPRRKEIRTPVEELLAGIWAEVLGVERVSPSDGFFELGGHSLLALQAVSRVRSTFGVELPLRAMFGPTLAALAEEVEAALRGGRAAEEEPLVPIARDGGPLPLSFGQERLWFFDRFEPGNPAYNIAGAVRLAGPLDPAALTRALSEVVRRHEALRATFPEEGGRPVQRIAPPAPFDLPMVDLSGWPEEAERLAAEHARRPFDLAKGPLLRATLVRLADSEHLLLVSMHHIVSDARSLAILWNEVSSLYEGAILPELPIQTADHTAWQREHLRDHLGFWREQLAGLPPVLELPLDRPRPAVQSFRGATLLRPLPPLRLADLARAEGVTPFMLFLAGFEALLFRWTGQEDFAVGSPSSTRDRVELEGLIGFFVNTLVLRASVPADAPFRRLLADVRETALSAYAHGDVSFEKIVEALAPERSAAVSPLFQVMFALEGVPAPPLTRGGLVWMAEGTDRGAAQLDLSLSVIDEPEGFRAGIEYAADLFDAATIDRFADHLGRLLEGIAADPDRAVADLPLLSAGERAQLAAWNDTAAPVPADLLIHDLFLQQAERTPDALAVVVAGRPEERLTYAELRERSGRIAGRLRALGVGPGSLVGLSTGRSLDTMASLLGILEAGAAYLPLDPDYPEERLAFMVEDSGATLVLTEKLPDGDVANGPRATPDDLAYVIYTSGSTGRPKGVMVPHRSLVNHAFAIRDLYELGETARVFQFASLSFDTAAEELYPTWLAGGCVVLWPELTRSSIAQFLHVIESEGITHIVLSSSYWHEWVAEMERTGASVPSTLRLVCPGAEPVSPVHLETWKRIAGDRIAWFNGYGPTETTITATAWRLAETREGRVPIGRPFANLSAHVVDRQGNLVPVGVAGELWIGGAGVTRGYLGRPDLTAEKFGPDPFAAGSGARAYRTGDLVRLLPSGDLDILGRIDSQVKVRGFRIELGEIESALAAHPAVSEAVAAVREERLVAYVVGEGADPGELRSWLRERLPEHMVPAAFAFVGAFPITPSGKLDRRALSRIAPEEDLQGGAAPRTPAEEILAGVFAEVLKREAVGIHDDFFDLGGHSLLATQAVSRVREAFGVELPLADLFTTPTVAGLAERLGALAGSSAPPLRPVPRDGNPPLSFSQERLWFLDRLKPGGAAYNMASALSFRGDLSVPALEEALRGVIRRHEALRTTFAERAGEAVQVIAPELPWSLPVVDLGATPGELRRLVAEEALRPFDLARGPLMRGVLVRVGPTEHTLLLTVHHIVSDGWSVGVMIREVAELYAAALEGRPAALPALPIQYADFAVWQRQWLQGDVLSKQVDFWRERLASAPELDLPTDRPRPAVQSDLGGVARFRVEPELTRDLLRLARRHGATLSMVLLSAFTALLRRLTGQDDLVVGTGIANRNRTEIEGLIGFFVNSLALRQDASGDPGFDSLLARTRRMALSAYAHQDLPFERLVEELRPERHLSHNPLFQVVVVLQNAPAGSLALPGLEIVPLDLLPPTSRFDLVLNAEEEADGLAVALEHSRDLFDASTARRMTLQLERLLAAVAADPGLRLSEIPLLGDGERQQLLVEWNDTRTARPAGSVLDLVAGSELAGRAGAVARLLKERGVGPEVPVGLLFERSLEMVTAALGVLAAGGAYVPLDPAYPAERLAYTVEETGMPVVLTVEKLRDRVPGGVEVVALDGDGVLGGAVGGAMNCAPTTIPTDGDHPATLPPANGTPFDVTTPSAAVVGAQFIAPPTPPRALPFVFESPDPDQTAYIIYTSGSTGKPKGVPISHGALANLVSWHLRTYGLTPSDRATLIAAPAFDAAVWEIWPALAAGASLHVPDEETRLQPARLLAWMAEQGITTSFLPTPLAEAVLDLPMPESIQLRALLTGGDRLQKAPRPGLPFAVVNHYGPTESTVVTTWAVAEPGSAEAPSIGRPMDNLRVHVVDRDFNPVPPGVPGELLIGGAGLSRGYWRRPELAAERFVPDPLGDEAGARLYRTGDLVRFRADGGLAFLGRIDDQVKVRGFRIETGEIETVLGRHAEVREAVVTVREGRLVAYVVPREEEIAAPEADEQVAQWQALYDETYDRSAVSATVAEDPAFNIHGWNSSYTGEPIPADEMRHWVESTVDRILDLSPRRVLEIGCGSGLLLFRVAPETERYHGIDFSPSALAFVSRHLQGRGWDHVSLARGLADDWSRVEPGAFDLVVINSVVQYFPHADYLARVLEGAVRTVAAAPGGGAVFAGDLRSLPLLHAFHASIELDHATPSLPVSELRGRVRRRGEDEEELVIDPAFFETLKKRLPEIRRVEVLVKDGRDRNELTRFRYDVVLHVSAVGEEDAPSLVWTDGSGLSLEDLDRRLAEAPEVLAFSGVADARTAADVHATKLLDSFEGTAGDLRAAASRLAEGALDPEDVWALAARHGYEAEITFDAAPGRFAAVLRRPGSTARPASLFPADRPLGASANDPLRGKLVRRLVPELRRFLRGELPEYMVPSAFVVLETLPLTRHGKVDRTALPAPDWHEGAPATAFAAPRNPTEEALTRIWSELLGVETAGIHDNFFELGGHSLLATQLVSRVRDVLGVEMPVARLFDHPTPAALAAHLGETAVAPATPSLPPVRPMPRDGHPPLSFSQQRLWFLDRFEPGSALYNMPLAMAIRGELDMAVLGEALREIVRRHESLRTTFAERGGEPVQVIAEDASFILPVIDLASLSAEAAEAEVGRIAEEDARAPFDLEAGPLVRGALARLGGDAHVLFLDIHHIVADGWSMGVLVREMREVYSALAAGRAPSLAPLPIQYADFALWQRRELGAELDRQLGWWRDRLANHPPALDLPADRPRPAVQSHRGAVERFVLPGGLADALERLGRQRGATPFMVFLAAYETLLLRYTGQEDLLVGTPVANRNRSEVEGLIGLFVNTLVIRTGLTGDPAFASLLARVREAALGAFAHQDLPFERLVEELQPERSLSQAPLFQVMFILQNVSVPALDLGNAKAEPLELGGDVAKFDLTLSMAGREFGFAPEDGLVGWLEYSTDLFDRATLVRLAGHLRTLFEGIVEDPERRLSDLPLLTAPEQHQLLAVGTATGYEPTLALHQLVERWAERTPDAGAVTCEGETLTYAKLNDRADRLAGHLRAQGVGPEMRVAVRLDRSLDMIVALLGILKAGGAYVPIDPAYPAERQAMILEDSGAALVVTDVSAPAAAPFPASVSPDYLAYVIFTSGSTGRPKGVQITHGSAVHRIETQGRLVGVKPGEVWTVFHSYAFDYSVWEIWTCLAHGGRLVITPFDTTRDAAAFHDLLAAERVTCVHQTPAALRQLVATWDSGGRSPAELAVRRVGVGGEAFPADLAGRLLDLGFEVWNFYGPTEATVWATAHRVTSGETGSVPLGRALPDMAIRILDRHFQPVPAGVPGELCITGAGLARGYIARPDLSAERFVPDPFGTEPGARLYRTGDLARRRADGALEYLGRIDHQVKVRGFRIELGEIESVLSAFPGVGEAVAIVREDSPGDRRIVAYVVPAGEEVPVAADLRTFLKERLPEPMIPSAFVLLPALPLNPNGKVDRKALPAPAAVVMGDGFEAPRTPTEETVAAAWCAVLHRESAGIHDDFFESGGHSLLATQLVSRLKGSLGIELPLRAVFETPTIAGLARAAEEAARTGHGVAAPPIRRREPGNELSLSFAQEYMWLIEQLEETGAAFFTPIPVRLRGHLDVPALSRSLDEVIRRHEALRTAFPVVDGRPVQRIASEARLELPMIDLSALPEDTRDAESIALAAALHRRPFDLARGPLVRAALLRLAGDDHHLVMTVHHILFDGWSGGVLLKEVATLYGAFAEGQPSPLPELPIQYADFAAWQRETLRGEPLEKLLGYWRDRLAAPVPELVLPGAKPGVTTLRSGSVPVSLPAELTAGLKNLARGEGMTLFVALLAAYQALLSRLTRQTDIPVGAPIANRNRPETEGLIGYFVNTLVMRTDLGGNPTFRELVGRVRETALGAYAHQDLPFTKLVEELKPERLGGRTPLFQVLFLLQNAPIPPIELPGLRLQSLESEVPIATYDLALVLAEDDGALSGTLWFNRDLLDVETVAAMTRQLRILLEGAVAGPDRRLSELPILTDEERRQLLEGRIPMETITLTRPAAALALDEEECLHRQFERRAADDPEAVALIFEEKETTYGELNEAANRLARHLRTLGVGPEVLVALCLERSPEMLVTILAVLKAGGAYLPLDPAYPAERLRFLLTDAGARVLVSQRTVSEHLPADLAAAGTQTVWLDDEKALLGSYDADDLEGGATRESLAYVIYTSGSTGSPKGVQVTHANVARLFKSTEDWFRFDERDVWTLFHSYAFDFSVWEMWGALLHGGQLAIVPHWVSRSPEAFQELLRRERVTVLNQTPTAFGQLAAQIEREAEASGRRDTALRSLRWVIFGGEALNFASLAPWFTRHGDRRPRLVNMYGITETTVHVTFRPVTAADATGEGSVSAIGEPIPDLQIHVLDVHLEPVPFGVPGEMYVGGAGLTRGYLGRPALTAERFVPDPFSQEPGARLYRTGDLARRTPDGDLETMGRADHQVKIRGFRIEPGEIEAALTAHPVVREAAVIAREDTPGDKRLVAYLVPDRERALPIRNLLRLEREGRLAGQPTYELPNGMVVVHQHEGVTTSIYKEIFEGEVYRRHGITLPEGAVVIDVGANMGLFTLWVGRTVKDARIFSFEPIPPTAEVLRLNAELYGLAGQAYAAGIADGERTETFTYYPFFPSTSGRFADFTKDRADLKAHIINEQRGEMDRALGDEAGTAFEAWKAEREGTLDAWLDDHMRSEKVACRLTTISAVLAEQGLDRIDLLKIDAERSELDALAGIADADWPKIRQMVLEVHDSATRDRVLEILAARGFEAAVEQDAYIADTDLYNVYARRPGLDIVPSPAADDLWASPNRLIEDVRHAAADRLPEHMVPAAYVVLEELPLTPHGKLDRRALPAPEKAARVVERSIVEARTPVEREMVDIWKELLGIDRISIYDNFFELGGHSLLLTQLASRIRTAFQVELPLRILFDVQDVVEMTEAIAERQVAQVDESEMAAMLSELKGLTPEEIQALLEQEG
jgi:pristinamycin I synthase-3/4